MSNLPEWNGAGGGSQEASLWSSVPQTGTSYLSMIIHNIYHPLWPNDPTLKLTLQFQYNSYLKCVDEWLRVNATCPTCRKSILPADASRGQNGNSEQSNNNGNMINISHGDRPGQRLITLNFEIPGDARITWCGSVMIYSSLKILFYCLT